MALLVAAVALAASAVRAEEEDELCGRELVASLVNLSDPELTCEERIVIDYDCCEEECADLADESFLNYILFAECGGPSGQKWLRQG